MMWLVHKDKLRVRLFLEKRKEAIAVKKLNHYMLTEKYKD